MRNLPDILRVAATLASGALPPSQLLRKFAAYPRQHYRMAGLNLLAAIVIYWNTAHLGEAVRQR